MVHDIVTQIPTNSKSPLVSKTVQAAAATLLTAIVGHFNPTAGAWLGAHHEYVMSAFALAVTFGRSGADQKIDWRNWTIKGIGFKF